LSRLKGALVQTWPRLAIIAIIVVIWAVLYATGYWDTIQLPSPTSVWDALWSHLDGRDGLLALAYRSLLRLFASLAVSIVVGTGIGLAMAASKVVQRSVGSLMVGLQALPSISWLPLAILWFGMSAKAILFVVVVGAVPAVAVGTASSVRLVPPALVRAGRTLGASGLELYGKVVLPAAVPGYIAGLQQAWAIAWRALMAAELFVTGARGLGHFVAQAGEEFDTPLVLATMIVIMLCGIGVDLLFTIVDRRVRRRRGLLVPS
jgi:NitT/TauT family transport system permease protein